MDKNIDFSYYVACINQRVAYINQLFDKFNWYLALTSYSVSGSGVIGYREPSN